MDSDVNMHLFHRIDIAIIYGIFIHKLSSSNAQSWMVLVRYISRSILSHERISLTTSSDIGGIVFKGVIYKMQ